VSAVCHDKPICKHAPYVKYELRPIPGAKPNGTFAHTPTVIDANAADNAVADTNGPNGNTPPIYTERTDGWMDGRVW
jgi:hypothetical protein